MAKKIEENERKDFCFPVRIGCGVVVQRRSEGECEKGG